MVSEKIGGEIFDKLTKKKAGGKVVHVALRQGMREKDKHTSSKTKKNMRQCASNERQKIVELFSSRPRER